jgi:hypothetical protein
VHLDGTTCCRTSPARWRVSTDELLVYFSDDGDVVALRYDNWKVVFLEQRCVGTLQLWAEPFVKLRVPKLFNLRTDPFENADVTSNTYWQWLMENAFIVAASQHVMREFLLTFLEYPPRQKAATFTVDQALADADRCPEIRGLTAPVASHRTHTTNPERETPCSPTTSHCSPCSGR